MQTLQLISSRQKVLISLVGFLSLVCILNANTSPVDNVTTDIYEGVIGIAVNGEADNPHDNVFHFNLDRLPTENEQVIMSLELYGVADLTHVGMSINDGLSVGGQIVIRSESWSDQERIIRTKNIKSGDNVIRFTIADEAEYSYRVRGISIRYQNKDEQLAERKIIIDQHGSMENGGFISGFVSGYGSERAVVFCNGKKLQNNLSIFESYWLEKDEQTTSQVKLDVYFSDGQIISKTVNIEKSEDDVDYFFRQPQTHSTQKYTVVGDKMNVIEQPDFAFKLPPSSVSSDVQLSMTQLRPIDVVALNDGMINVTKNCHGLRCLPHGIKFKKEGILSLYYDENQIPTGYNEADLRIFYFDEEKRTWIALENGFVDQESHKISAPTDHFTDFIVGVIQVPESPRTETFLSTTLSSIADASAAEEISFIQPPTANFTGSATTEFPIPLPQGRQGMHPDLSIRYDSEGGNGWCGVGWDLSTPSIHVETRWGVPRYSASKETETYNILGKQLAPVAHRGEPVDRTSEKRFYHRIETSFSKIIRHGNSPKNYWWEVTNTVGTKQYYGGRPDSGVEPNAVLKDANGNIAQWELVEERDLHGNFITYSYEVARHSGVSGASVQGSQIYLSDIYYTGHETTTGPFRVEFFRDRELGETERTDIGISARSGFKQVNADLLRKIEISYEGSIVRSFELTYKTGAFFKSLLQDIICFDEVGQEFYRHSMEYYDDVRRDGNYHPFQSGESWSGRRDQITGEILAASSLFPNETSLLGGSASSDWSLGGAATVGLIGDLLTKINTAGVNFTYGRSDGRGLIAFVDINGDGLSDKVFRKDNRLSYRPNQSNINPSIPFGEERPIRGISHFSQTATNSYAGGVEAHPGIGFVGYTNTTVVTTVSTYFSDFNGDGLIDVVFNGTVYFNHLNTDGDPVFTLYSGDTPSPIQVGSAIDGDLIVVDPDAQEAKIDGSPLHDVVRMWEAPYDGSVRVTGSVNLLEDTSPESVAYTKKDGVRLTIQIRDDQRWSTIIEPDDFSTKTPSNVDNLEVEKGDRIYFRVQSRFDGAYDQVRWNPIITYRNEPIGALEPTGKPFHRFTANEDFILASCQTVSMPLAGKVKLTGRLIKPITSDDIIVAVVKENDAGTTFISQDTYRWNQTVDVEQLVENISIETSDVLLFKIFCATNVNWSEVKWTPLVTYTSTDDGTPVTGPDGSDLISFCPAPEYQMYTDAVVKTTKWTAPSSGELSIDESLNFTLFPSGLITLSVKGPKKLYAKSTFLVTAGSPNMPDPIVVNVAAGDELFIEYHAQDPQLARWLSRSSVQLTFDGSTDRLSVGFHAKRKDDDVIFGPMYRNWGLFAYNGNRDRATQIIHEDQLEINEDGIGDVGDIEDVDDPDNIGDTYDVSKEAFVLLVSDIKNRYWIGSDNLTYVRNDTISSSRLGEDDVLPPTFIDGGSTLTMPAIKTKSYINSFAGGVSLGPGGASASVSFNSTKNEIDVLDVNGDRFPDVVTEAGIQYTNMRGGLDENAVMHNLGHHEAGSFAWGLSASVGFVHSSATNSGDVSQSGSSGGKRGSMKTKGTSKSKSSRKSQRSGRAKSNVNKSSKKSNDASRDSKSGVGIDGGFTSDRDSTEQTWTDINGDGLVDMLYKDGTVALNLGYSFTPRENWGFAAIREGSSFDYGGGLGVNLFNGSIVSGLSINRTDNYSDIGLIDVNGDGLVDLVIDIEPMRVRLNTGNGFANEVTWHGADFFDKGSATGESANVAFTVCIPIVILGIKICVNPSSSLGRGVSRITQQLDDADGDGFVDYLESSNDGELNIRRSTINRTNLLKRINRPLGGMVTLDYAAEGNTFDLPFSKWVLSSVEVHDGVVGDGVDRRKTNFEYSNGKYDRHERDFYGFNNVYIHELDTENSDAVYRTSTYEYDVSNYYSRGLQLSYGLSDAAGNPFHQEENEFVLKDVLSASPLPPVAAQDDAGMAFPALLETRTYFYEGDAGVSLQTSVQYTYDEYGNLIQSVDRGDGTTTDKLITDITYHKNDAQHNYSIPSIELMTADGKTLRHTEQDVDDVGNVVQIRNYLEPDLAATTDLDYDDYGNIIEVIQPKNINGQRMFYQYKIDEDLHQYVVQTNDAYGYQSNATYDLKYGKLIHQIDFNGQEMKYTLDEKGRISTIIGPYELASGAAYSVAYEYHVESLPAFAITKRYETEHEHDLLNTTYVDGYGNVVQTKKMGMVSDGNSSGQLMTLVSGADYLDAFGRIRASYHPITEAIGSFSYNSTVDNITPVTFTYDILDRGTEITLQDGALTRIDFKIAPDNTGALRLIEQTIDAEGNITASYRDTKDRVRAEMQQGPNGEIWGNFEYNAISEFLKIIDTESFETEYVYDQLGRQITTFHPDAGTTRYAYDLASNLYEKTNDKIQDQVTNDGAIKYTIDFDRVVEINYPKNYQNKVQLHYGGPDAKFNRVGRLWLREDASGGEEMFYGALGETTKSIRTLLISQNNIQTYVTEFEYDTWGRLQVMKYPDGEIVSYDYDKAGELTAIHGLKSGIAYRYIDAIGYDKFEQRNYLKYGNNTVTTYEFEEDRRRMKNMSAVSTSGQQFANTFYAYDNINNITSIENTADPVANGLGGPVSHTYEYDEIYRLKHASGHWKGSKNEHSYEIDMSYDDLHNILSKAQKLLINNKEDATRTYNNIYAYESTNPHMPSKISGRQLSFDPAGNLLSTRGTEVFTFSQLQWDEENRLIGVSNNGYISRFTYDGNGQRVIKSHGGEQGVFVDGATAGAINHVDQYTAYVSPFFVVEKGKFTKHYFADEQRLLSKVGNGQFNFPLLGEEGFVSAGHLDYSKRMRLLRLAQDEYYKSLGIPPGAPTLYGHSAQPEVTGNPLPNDINGTYNLPPDGWPRASANPDTSGAPGPPVLFIDAPDSLEISASYAFDSTGSEIFKEHDVFYYHLDHLGSAHYLTDITGELRQHTAYTPFGELFVEEHTSSTSRPYKFNGKEYDEQTGYYYYGSRYYDPKLSIWNSVDPLTEKFPTWSPYAYTFHNPMNYIDHDGREPGDRFSSPTKAAFDFANKYNPLSIEQNAEYGSSIYFDKNIDGYTYTHPAIEAEAGVTPSVPPAGIKVIADIHTHSAYSSDYENDSFSSTDLADNREQGTIGYLANPRGRLRKFDPNDGPNGRISTKKKRIPADPKHPKVRRAKRAKKRAKAAKRTKSISPNKRNNKLHLGSRSRARN